MNKTVIIFLAGMLALSSGAAFGKGAAKESGKQLFETNCAACHKDGGNIINPAKTLSKKDREKNGVKNAADIVKLMRNPGPGMTKFDEKTVPDKQAKEIAEYIIKTFK